MSRPDLLSLSFVCSGHFDYGHSKAVQFAFANVLVTVLVRQAVLIRALYFILLHTVRYQWVPLIFKHGAVSLIVHIAAFTADLLLQVYCGSFMALFSYANKVTQPRSGSFLLLQYCCW